MAITIAFAGCDAFVEDYAVVAGAADISQIVGIYEWVVWLEGGLVAGERMEYFGHLIDFRIRQILYDYISDRVKFELIDGCGDKIIFG